MKLKITKLARYTNDKTGNPLITSDGRQYTRLQIRTQEYGAKVLSGFSAPWNESWKEGSTVDCDVEQKGEYLNIKRPDPMAEMSKAVMNLASRFRDFDERLKAIEKINSPSAIRQQMKNDEIIHFDESGAPVDKLDDMMDDSDLPF